MLRAVHRSLLALALAGGLLVPASPANASSAVPARAEGYVCSEVTWDYDTRRPPFLEVTTLRCLHHRPGSRLVVEASAHSCKWNTRKDRPDWRFQRCAVSGSYTLTSPSGKENRGK